MTGIAVPIAAVHRSARTAAFAVTIDPSKKGNTGGRTRNRVRYYPLYTHVPLRV